MPRKIQSSGVSTQDRKTSRRRAAGAAKGSGRSASPLQDGGKWEGTGKKTVEHGEGPAVVNLRQPGRGAKTRTVIRKKRTMHPSHG